jgi:hypothetical protein
LLKKQVELLQEQLKKIEKGKNKEFYPKEQITPENDIKSSGGNLFDHDNSEQVLTRYDAVLSKNTENGEASNSKDSSIIPSRIASNKVINQSKNNEGVKDHFCLKIPIFFSEAEKEQFRFRTPDFPFG